MKKLPVGYPVSPLGQLLRPNKGGYEGEFVSLAPVNPKQDIDELYEGSHGSELNQQLWTYMPYGPFDDKPAMLKYLDSCSESEDPFFLTVTGKASGHKCGVVSFLNIVPAHQTIELGHIWYSPSVQRSKVNTEVIYLMLCESFERLGYRRVEWKCNALNARSRAAAQRLGFSFEGIFYKHLIVKGRNRDTAWLAMVDDDWIRIKPNFEQFLYGCAPDFSLTRANCPLLRAIDTGDALS